jgi:hypothetical protein
MLHPPMSTLGLKGMQKLAAELARWPEQLTSAQLDACLRHLVEFTGFPPVPPSRLTGYADAPYSHAAGRDIFASLLRQLAQDYHEPGWASAAQHFDRSAAQLETLTDTICDYILGVTSSLETAAALIAEIAESETKGFSLLSATKFK